MRRTMMAWMACGLLYACGDEGGAANSGDDPNVEACPAAELEAGQTTLTVTHDGVERTYLVHVPANLDRTKPAPLVLNYHGLTSNPAAQVAFSDLNRVADKEGFLVAYPEGINASFNGEVCCSQFASQPHQADDAGFARALVADLSKRACVDRRRVYSTGMSNGGYMSEYNACKNADLFAAVAPVSALGILQTNCNPSRPVPMIAFNGTMDGLVSYTVSVDSVKSWVERNGCEGEPTREDKGEKSYCESWTRCEAGVEVVHCTFVDMGHCWPGQASCPYGGVNLEVDASAALWEFLRRFTLPQ
jgi:polyhydroxybutyrate depolymerase